MVFDDFPHRNTGLDHTSVVYWTPPADAIQAARHRLVADGWTIDDRQYPPGAIMSGPEGPPSDGFTAYRDDLALHVHRSSYPPLMLTVSALIKGVDLRFLGRAERSRTPDPLTSPCQLGLGRHYRVSGTTLEAGAAPLTAPPPPPRWRRPTNSCAH